MSAASLSAPSATPAATSPRAVIFGCAGLRLDEAVARLHEALSDTPELPQAQYELGRALEKQQKFQEAIVPLQRAIQLDPLYPEPHYTLGRIFQRQGKREEAQQEIEKFKKLKNESSTLQSPALNQIIPSAGVPLREPAPTLVPR